MAKAKTQYSDKWIPSSEAVAQLVRFHASRPEQLFKYDGDGVAEMQLAIACGFITCGLLVLSDRTQEEVTANYLRHDPKRLATGYDQERQAEIYLLRHEMGNLTRESGDASDEQNADASVTATAILVSRSPAAKEPALKGKPAIAVRAVDALPDLDGLGEEERHSRVQIEARKITNKPNFLVSPRIVRAAVSHRRKWPRTTNK